MHAVTVNVNFRNMSFLREKNVTVTMKRRAAAVRNSQADYPRAVANQRLRPYRRRIQVGAFDFQHSNVPNQTQCEPFMSS
jgi:hypothetical protein